MQSKLPMIAFAQGESERSIDKSGDRHFKFLTNEITFRYSLVNQGFDVEKVYLKAEEIPKDITALVIADPRIAFDTASMRKIEAYIAGGGNLLLAGEPGKQDILNPILRLLGVQLMDGMLVQRSKNASPEVSIPSLTSAAAGFTKQLHDDYNDSVDIAMHGAAALSYMTDGPFTVTPLAVTPAGDSWNKKIKPTEDMIELADDVEATQNVVMVDNSTGVSATFVANGNLPQSNTRSTKSAGKTGKPGVGAAAPGAGPGAGSSAASSAAPAAAPGAAPSAAPAAAPGAAPAAAPSAAAAPGTVPAAGPVRRGGVHNGAKHTGLSSGTNSIGQTSPDNTNTSDSTWAGLAYDAAKGDQKGPLPTVLGLTRTINGKQQRIVVAGDADFLSNASLGSTSVRNCNFDFSTAIFSWFANGEFPIDTSRPPSKDTRLDLTDGKLYFEKILMMWILPGILLIVGSILLIRRKRK
jgi:ABC-2 type transport system permease protein